MTPYERVQLSRQRTNDTFPFPALRPSIDYTICEFAGEYRDAVLRDERTDDKRNTVRGHDARAELGDSFYMLLSACIKAHHEPEFRPVIAWSRRRRCNEIVRYLAYAADYAQDIDDDSSDDRKMDYLHINLENAYSNMIALAASHGWPVDSLIDDTCARFEAKHAPGVA